jgi:octaprenyl-diphosphate synthase
MVKPFSLIKEELKNVESEIQKSIVSDVTLIPEIGKHIFFSGGKRFRPALMILCSRLFQKNSQECVHLAGVIELIHTATLLHDDVVDAADLRRGVESANTIWGNEASILVGDFLFSQAFRTMVAVGNLEILEILALTTKKMSEGEMFQLSLGKSISIKEDDYMRLIYNKTAVLIASACQIGAILGNAEEKEREKLIRYGEGIGIAFQLVDDTLDYYANSQKIGKPVGNDLAEKKATLPLISALKRMSDAERTEVERIFYADTKTTEDFEYVKDLITQNGGLDYTLQKAREFSEKAKTELTSFPPSKEKQALQDMADYVVERAL